ncbi:phenylalanine--tRNA ligase subunit beta [Candidatus Nitrospira allomarina]|uniref:phenylalanine--tRNA ligase n=1 Tax=Candidatus Nitrospira allomarina TaxID=3020900 RepID=A0AA96JSY8_9BACT|nr:phenylalanine--tRNA ligase subunit beta [Candidatus Nitrospira allomarina]WNM59037.1 phenylalanine--tRNA ligase subunit beta [Candidatus Nitrospira allomarina]
MPTISIFQKDFCGLVGRDASMSDIEQWMPYVKGEVKDVSQEAGEVRVELQDTNRPDLWCVEGIARQIRSVLNKGMPPYSFFSEKRGAKRRIQVAQGMEAVRPYVAGCVSLGYAMTPDGLNQCIQTQEKLADAFGRKRETVSIGLYRASAIAFPVTYGLVKPDEIRFTPLGFEEKMTPQEILTVHPKGLEYGSILAGCERLPLLWDSDGQVLSFPPIINSRELGEVQIGDTDLLVEVTGTDLSMVVLALNIFACNLADRGATIESLDINYPYKTDFGTTIKTPLSMNQSQRISIEAIEQALGMPLGSEAIQEALASYGYQVKATRQSVSVTLPAFRNDFMHVMDVAEDVAITRGYESFSPIMPQTFTVGSLSMEEQISDRMRDLLVGFGFQEIFSNIMASHQELVDRMRITDTDYARLVEVDNVMSQTYACLRPSILPCLLRVEALSPRAFYPHLLFEVGETAQLDLEANVGSRTTLSVAAISANSGANFSEIHSYLDLLMYYMAWPYELEPVTHPSFLEGRVGRIRCEGYAVGYIGEFHPEVLEAWQIDMPTSGFEFEIRKPEA